jgi:hypothetical protein
LRGEEHRIAEGERRQAAGAQAHAPVAESSTTDSRRGFANRLSPTQIESNTSAASACSEIANSSSTLVAPNSTPRFGRLSP